MGETGGRKGGGGATGRSAALTLINDSSQEVCYVYISPDTDDSWGDDWLGTEETILPGDSYTFQVPAGSYDLLARDCDSNVMDEQYGTSVAGALEWTITDQGVAAVNLTLTNDSGLEVCYVYVSPTAEDSWGDDWLGADVIPDGASYTFQVPIGSYDLLAEDCSENVLANEYGLSIHKDTDWSISPVGGGEATITLYNYTDRSIWYVYISPSTSDTWGEDWLVDDVVPIDASYTFQLAEGTYDLKAEDDEHNVVATRFDEYISGDQEWTLYLEDQATLTLINNSGETVCYVYISASGEATWGNDWLGTEETIASGGRRAFQVAIGSYDLLAENCDHDTLEEKYDVNISGALEWTVNP